MDDFFTLFGLPATYAIDSTRLDRAYRDVQAKVHPDRFTSGSDAERRVAMQWAAHANQGYQTLRDPMKRARYLCEQAGVDLGIETDTKFDAVFLMQQLEWREALGDARAGRDEAAIDRLDDELASQRTRYARDAQALIDERHDMPAAAELVRRWMFIDRLTDEVGSARAAFAD